MAVFSAKDVSHMGKLDGTHVSFQICLTLKQHGLIKIVEGKLNIPTPVLDASNVITNEDSIKQWRMQDNSAQCFIATIDQPQLRTLMSCKSAHDMWLRLTAQYEQAASENKYSTHQRN